MLSRFACRSALGFSKTSHFFPRQITSTHSYLQCSNFSSPADIERESMEFDVVIVGGGPAGLSAAIRLGQLAQENGTELDICLLEKGAEIGSHILSGNVFNPTVLNQLIPDWKDKGADAVLNCPVTRDALWYMTEQRAIGTPFVPPDLRNTGNYIISLGALCRWLGEQAEELGVMVMPGFSASEPLFNTTYEMIGVATSDVGLNKDGTAGPNFERGSAVLGRQTILAEGCRGSLSEEIMTKYDLRTQCDPQTYALGFKEVWEVKPHNHEQGLVMHGIGYPTLDQVYAGNFMYHAADNQVFIGIVIGLEYENPYLNPYLEFQKLKKHPKIASVLEGGECISYGARAMNGGGYQAIPQLSFPGGVLTGCSAGFVNIAKVKGTHYAMQTGITAAEEIFEALQSQNASHSGDDSKPVLSLQTYDAAVKESWVMKELHSVRNVKPAFNYGKWVGMAQSSLTTTFTRGKEPYTLRNGYKCADKTRTAGSSTPIHYDKPDGKLTFDILTNLQRSNTYHEDTEPSHLKIKKDKAHVAESVSWDVYRAPETRFCPAKVYEFVENSESKKMELVINSQNCIHCKTCAIKTPEEYIQWTVPQGGGGPKYGNM